jgi:hypothetical protein
VRQWIRRSRAASGRGRAVLSFLRHYVTAMEARARRRARSGPLSARSYSRSRPPRGHGEARPASLIPSSRDELAGDGDELRQLLRMPAGERRELLQPDLVGVVRQALVDPREIMPRDLQRLADAGQTIQRDRFLAALHLPDELAVEVARAAEARPSSTRSVRSHQTCAALAAFVGAVGVYRLQSLKDKRRGLLQSIYSRRGNPTEAVEISWCRLQSTRRRRRITSFKTS